MIKWRIDKSNKVPLYLQLKDLIKYYISTGTIKDNHQLPGVNTLGGELGVNFETVRKAYKELEKEGLISMQRGRGTYVTLHNAKMSNVSSDVHPESDPKDALRIGIRKFLRAGSSTKEIRKIVAEVIDEIAKEGSQQTVVFAECNLFQVREISKVLRNYLNLNVKPVLVDNLRNEVETILKGPESLLAVVTTGFHINEARKMLEDIPVDTQVLITSMSSETRQKLLTYDRKSHFGFICRDAETIPFWEDLIKDELGKEIILSCSILDDRERVEEILKSVNVLMVSPPAYKALKKTAPAKLPLFNVFDKVDAMSLRLIKNRLSEIG
jgi:DNA-binding transcriptional regulator YhcF (GntR family)